jgi:hypothetical protein
MKKERIWSNVKETTFHLQNKLTKNIHLGDATSTVIVLNMHEIFASYVTQPTFHQYFLDIKANLDIARQKQLQLVDKLE